MYIFDDILANLDKPTAESIMKETIVKSLKDKTVILVTHSMKFLKYADKVIYLDEGRVKFDGKF